MSYSDRRHDARGAARAGMLLGLGFMGAFDVIVFHQILQWHHFYVHANEFWRIASDGFFHLLPLALLVAATLVLWRMRRDLSGLAGNELFWSRVLLGAGAFQLFDGTVLHLVVRVHPVRVGVTNLLPYDLGWIGSALLLLALGAIVSGRAVRPGT